MTISAYTQLVQDTLKPLVSTAYNLNYKNVSHPPERVWCQDGNTGITIYPNGLDYTKDGLTKAVKWELINDTVANVTFPYEDSLFELINFLKVYLFGATFLNIAKKKLEVQND
ncbi:hypothetical protein PHABIO_327 [Pseudomonas phage Phabio]|uniref:Uncharacterized protein n=1 Tax=Pseudomonas phage Phabio TaxID=2006668 RepID=A0A1Y0T0E6_9CAUD|nr:hypothetical protein MZD05_gp327 [Pseudomonas phage Phabio]ARV76958.1 hypothetical protein PHABIO_327 [Pseudomonas phage Phabio]